VLLASGRRNDASFVESSDGFAAFSGFSGIGVVSAKVVARAANSDEQHRLTVWHPVDDNNAAPQSSGATARIFMRGLHSNQITQGLNP